MKKYPLLSLIGLAWAWTWITQLPLLLQKRGFAEFGLPDASEAVGAFGPFVAAVLVMRAADPARRAEFWSSFRRWPARPGWQALVLLSPVWFLVAAAALVTVRSGALPSIEAFANGRLGTLAAVGELLMFGALLQSLGEEPGWRGVLLPGLLERFRRLPASLLLFPVWWLWHLPFFLMRPDFGLPQFLGFGLGILSASIWMTFLWEGTRSILVAVVWHVLLNITRQVSLGFSTAMFLSYGLVVTVGAVAIVGYWGFSARRTPPAPHPAGR
jgi:membrane protease YdiL (CAAX protease family)